MEVRNTICKMKIFLSLVVCLTFIVSASRIPTCSFCEHDGQCKGGICLAYFGPKRCGAIHDQVNTGCGPGSKLKPICSSCSKNVECIYATCDGQTPRCGSLAQQADAGRSNVALTKKLPVCSPCARNGEFAGGKCWGNPLLCGKEHEQIAAGCGSKPRKPQKPQIPQIPQIPKK